MKQCLQIELDPQTPESVRLTSPQTLFHLLSHTLSATCLYHNPLEQALLENLQNLNLLENLYCILIQLITQ